MSDASYDAIVIGGGHNALTIACYLAMNGMKVGVFEEKWELGGGTCSEECTAPGFVSDTCSTSQRIAYYPTYRDLKLYDYGLRFVFPENYGSIIFDNEDYIVSYPAYKIDQETGTVTYVSEGMDKAYKEIAKISEKDAETALKLHEKFEKHWKEKANMAIWNPPPRPGEEDPLQDLLRDPVNGIDPRYLFMNIGQIAYDVFESSHMRIYYMRSAGSFTNNFPCDLQSLPCLIFTLAQLIGVSPTGVTVGGSHQIAHAMQRNLSSHGGEFWVLSPVDKVLIENGTAKGIRLRDGTEIEAKKMVISSIDIYQTILNLIEQDYVSDNIRHRVRSLDSTRGCVWFGSFALHERPKYMAEAANPDVVTLRSFLCPLDATYMRYRYQADFFSRGFGRKLFIHPYHHSTFDKSRAPAGKYEIAFEEWSCPASFFTLGEWLDLKKVFLDELLKQWQIYAPNMTWDNVVNVYCNTPYEIQMRNSAMREGCVTHITWDAAQAGIWRPIPELARNKTPIKNLYIGSASTHSRGYVSGDPGYNCYKVIAEDFGLRKFWEEAGRPY